MDDGPLLEVSVTQDRDVAGALEGGADRLFLTRPGPTCGLAPEPASVTAVVRASELPVRVNLRLEESWTTTGGGLRRLVGLAEDYLGHGAEGVCFGFLDADLRVDVELCTELAGALPGVPWTFNRAVDATLEPRRAWRQLLELPGLTAVRSAGSPRGMAEGYDDLLATAQADERVASLLLPTGGLLAEHVPWLLRAGAWQFNIGPQARPDGSPKAYVDAALVRSWRLLLDDTGARSR